MLVGRKDIHILLVEDNPADRDLVVEYLEMEALVFSVEYAATLQEARESLAQNQYDVVLLDLGLPDSVGVNTLTGLMGPFPEVPFVALTGQDDDAIARLAIKKGAQDYLIKGKTSPEQIRRAISYAIERKNAENELAAIYENAPILMMLVDRDRRIQRLNKITTVFAGRSEEELAGLRGGEALRCIHAADVPEGCGYSPFCEKCVVRNAVLHTLKTGESIRNRETSLAVNTEEGERTLFLSISANRLLLNKEPKVLVAIQDVTERREAEESLRRSEAFLNATGKMASVGGWEVDARTREVKWTGVTYDIHELPRSYKPSLEEAIDFFHPEDVPALKAAVAKALERGEPYDMEVRFITARGRELWTHTKCVPITEDGEVVRLLGTFQDVTDKKAAEAEKQKLEEQYRQAQKMESVGRLAGGIAHDLNNMLSPILGYAEILLDDFEAADDRKGSVEEIFNAGIRARDLVRQLLAFGRKQALEVSTVNLNEILARIERLLRRAIREDIGVYFIPHQKLPSIRADVGQVEQVIMNLAINAQDAMPSGGKILIETDVTDLDEIYAESHPGVSPGRYVMMAITDTGHGMDAEARKKAFEPFYTTKKQGRGTGLGLATVYGIVTQHGGSVWVYSEPGMGATFKVYFPAAEGRAQASQEHRPQKRRLTGTETVVVAEDDPMVRNLAVRILEDHGYDVIFASCGRECLDLLEGRDGPLHLLLTDVVMPEMNGKELYHKVAERHPQVKVVYMSGYTEDVILDHGVLEKDIAYLQKPFSVHSLAAKVRDVLDRQGIPG